SIKLQLAKDPLKQDEDEAGRIKKALLAVEDSLEDEERDKIMDLHVLSGSGSYEFTDPSPYGYTQYELVTYLHLYNQNTLLKVGMPFVPECVSGIPFVLECVSGMPLVPECVSGIPFVPVCVSRMPFVPECMSGMPFVVQQ
ncbi:unnamed protein product, partial [Timema podura]|nr:unnamed protein product [Timema podura]